MRHAAPRCTGSWRGHAGMTPPICLCAFSPSRCVTGLQNDPVLEFRAQCLPSCDKSFFLEGNMHFIEWGSRGPKGKRPARGQRVVQGTAEPGAPWLEGRGGVAHIPRSPALGSGNLRLPPGLPVRDGRPSAESVPKRRPDHRTCLTFQVWLSRGRLWPCGRSGLNQPQTTALGYLRELPGLLAPSRGRRPSPGCRSARVQPVANRRVEVGEQGLRGPLLHTLDFPHRGAIKNIFKTF